MNVPFSPPDISENEIEEVVKTLRSGWITTGPRTKEFEKRIASTVKTPKAVCLNSATAAMELTLRLLGVGAGDEVITSAYTYTATASVIEHVGATIKLVDTVKNGLEMDYDALEKAISPNTKVIIPVDIAGVICDYERIFSIIEAKKHMFTPANDMQAKFNRIVVMADAAHAFGAKQNGVPCGNIADFTCFSFHAVKNLTTAEGGAVVWKEKDGLDNEEIYKQYMLLSLHGQSKDALAKTRLGSWEYDIVIPGYKCNMTDIMAAIGLRQLDRYEGMLKRRKEIIEKYNAKIKAAGIRVLEHFGENHLSSGHLYLTFIPNCNLEQRNEIIVRLASKGIAANVHYKPLPLLTAYKSMGFDIADYPNAYSSFECEVTLPLHTLLTDEQVDYVADTYIETVKEVLG